MAILRVKDEQGNIIEIPAIKGDKGDKGEKGDKGDSTYIDVLINGASIIDENGNANIPIAKANELGVVKPNVNNGVMVNTKGELYLCVGANGEVDSRTTKTRVITTSNYDYAVKQAMCDGKGAEWTQEEKAKAQARIGLDWKLLGDITVEEDGVAKIKIPIDNPNYNEYQFYVYVADRKKATAQNMSICFDDVTSTSYSLTYASVGTNVNYFMRGYTLRNCNNGWLTLCIGSKDGKPCSQSHIRAVDYYAKDGVSNTELPSFIEVSLSTGLDIGSRFVVYAR